MSKEVFLLAIEKELARSERRDLVFSVIRFEPQKPLDTNTEQKLFTSFRQRLRIIDEMGVYESGLGVLLPETVPSDAGVVANDLTEIASRMEIGVECEIYVFPERIDEDQDTSQFPVEEFAGTTGNGNGATQADAQNGANSTATHVHNAEQTISFKTWLSRPTPFWKRSFDLFGSVAGLVLLSPIMLTTGAAIRLTSRGPVIYTQLREGKDGKCFKILKFRTMYEGADEAKADVLPDNEQDGPAFKLKDDPRLTKLGRYLRITCIDELPQLFNVLIGNMSLVGPRPLPVDESYSCLRWQRRRLSVLPGMTGIWQVQGDRDIPFEEWMRMDLQYIRQRSLLNDVKLLCRTAWAIVLHRGSG